MRIRIVCKAPPPRPSVNGSPRVDFVPSWYDVMVVAVDGEGVEHPIDGVASITWACKQGEVTTAVMHLEGIEIDAEGEVSP